MVDGSIVGRPEEVRPARKPMAALRSKALLTWRLMPRGDRLALLAMIVAVALGLWLRVRGMFFQVVPLWGDEATWTEKLLREDVREYLFRPLGFMVTTNLLVKVFGATEPALRFLPWIAGALSLLATVPISRLLFRSNAARLLLVSAVALQPAAIDLAREFKPYSVAFGFHTGIILGALSYMKSRRRRTLWLTLTFALVGMFFSQDVIFAYPSLYLALGYPALRERRTADLKVLLVSVLVTLAVLLLLYFFTWRTIVSGPSREPPEYWGHKYDVFFTGNGPFQRLRWWLEKYRDTAALPGLRRYHWPGAFSWLASADRWLWAILHVVGILVIAVRRRLSEGLLLIGPLLVLSAFNALGLWPFGAFRTNLFTLAYAAPLAAMAFEWPTTARARNWAMVPALLIVFAPLALFEQDWNRRKDYFAGPSALPQEVRALIDMQGQSYTGPHEWVVLDSSACSPWRYYTLIHPRHERFSVPVNRRFRVQCQGGRNAALRGAQRRLKRQGGGRVWVVFNDGRSLSSLEKELDSRGLTVAANRTVREDVGLILAVRQR